MPDLDHRPILGPDGSIARRLPGYEPRVEQQQMAVAVAEAIEGQHHLMVEAGTGVGKSFAYLVPAILAAAEQGKKVVISTHTISLQEQLLEKDIPFLRAVMPHEFSAVLVKGRSNYVSLRRLESAIGRAGASFNDPEDFRHLDRLKKWAGKTEDGSRSDLDFKPSPAVWESVASENGNCLGKNCPKFKECHYFKARRRAWSANILIVNHALFMTDLALRSVGAGFLPEYQVAIFDEAHTLEEVAGEHLGLRVTNSGVDYVLSRLYNERTSKGLLAFHGLHEAMEQVVRARAASRDFFEAVARWQSTQGASNGRVRSSVPVTNSLSEELKKLATRIARGAEETPTEEERIELSAAAVRCEGLANSLSEWMGQGDPDGTVHWIEMENGQKRVTLARSPLEVGPTLRRALFEQVPTCILTSATLAVGSPPGFAFAKSRIGLTSCKTLQLGSPFDYAKQVTIHLPKDLPDPSEDVKEYERRAIVGIRHYLKMSHGKAFVLFTSYRMMEEAARALTPWLAERNIALFTQGDGMSRSKMIAAFKQDLDSVIFGTDSFWQGVDVPGEALSNVIITKLPFSVPDKPLLQARLEAIRKRGGNPFIDFQVPEAIIKLKQGFGRLIRSKADRGIVAILDPRILTKPYGRQFLGSLPDCPRVTDIIGNS